MKFLLFSFATFFLLGLVAAQIPQCDDLPVNCFADPCSVTTCKTGVCQTSTCNCDAYCMCKSDSDCAEDEFCRTLGWEEDAGAACHRFAQEGESCGGFVMPSYLETCAAGLVCDYRPFIADAPGTCRRECEISKDCENENQYCSEAGTCKDLGDCGSTADCLNNDNAFIRIECVGLTYCNWDGTCAVDCSPSCKDSSDCPPEFFCGKDNLCVMDVFCDASECDGPAPLMPNSQCSDGSVSGPVCMLNPNGACSWQIRDCPVYVPPASCVPSDCDGPAPLFASQLCPDGTIAGPICVMAGYYYNFASSADIIIDGVERQSSPDGVEEQSFPGSGPNGGSQCVWQVSFCPPPVGSSEPCDISKCPDAHTEDAMVCPDGTTFGRQCLYDDTIIVDPLPGTNPENVEGERTCSWLFPPCPTEVNECPKDQCPPVHTMMARMCDDGSVAQDLCVTAPDNSCVWTLVCPEDQHNNGQCKKGKGCDHPLAGPCLGICGVSETEEEMCFLNRYDTCTGRGVTVIAISNSAAESMERVLQDIRKVLDIKSKHLVRPLRTLANIYVVELVDEEDVKRNNGEASSERLARKLLDMTRSELLQGTTLQEADFVVLPAQSHIRDLHQDNNNDSSSSEATAVYPFMAVLALLSVVAGLF